MITMCDNTTEVINLNAEMHKMHKKCRKVKKNYIKLSKYSSLAHK